MYIQGNSKVRWRRCELEEEGERERNIEREKIEVRIRAHEKGNGAIGLQDDYS